MTNLNVGDTYTEKNIDGVIEIKKIIEKEVAANGIVVIKSIKVG